MKIALFKEGLKVAKASFGIIKIFWKTQNLYIHDEVAHQYLPGLEYMREILFCVMLEKYFCE